MFKVVCLNIILAYVLALLEYGKVKAFNLFDFVSFNCLLFVLFREKAFGFEVSNVEWPSEANENTLLANFADSLPDIIDANDTSAALRSNVLRLEIYYQEFNYETIRERPSYRVSLM